LSKGCVPRETIRLCYGCWRLVPHGLSSKQVWRKFIKSTGCRKSYNSWTQNWEFVLWINDRIVMNNPRCRVCKKNHSGGENGCWWKQPEETSYKTSTKRDTKPVWKAISRERDDRDTDEYAQRILNEVFDNRIRCPLCVYDDQPVLFTSRTYFDGVICGKPLESFTTEVVEPPLNPPRYYRRIMKWKTWEEWDSLRRKCDYPGNGWSKGPAGGGW
jgi:hypothetical protein